MIPVHIAGEELTREIMTQTDRVAAAEYWLGTTVATARAMWCGCDACAKLRRLLESWEAQGDL